PRLCGQGQEKDAECPGGGDGQCPGGDARCPGDGDGQYPEGDRVCQEHRRLCQKGCRQGQQEQQQAL
ncbi:hypothetical protein BGX29_000996, partial [Mortierella sp. GBA35]